MTLSLERLDPGKTYHGLKSAGSAGGFDCGLPVINEYVADGLRSAVKVGNCVAFVLLDDAKKDAKGNPFLAGFYTVAMAQIAGAPLKQPGKARNPPLGNFPPQISCLRLVMLGVDAAYKGQGFGSRLMQHAIGRAKLACDESGGRGLYLDADPGAVGFYLGLGFLALEGPWTDKTTPMFLFKEAFF